MQSPSVNKGARRAQKTATTTNGGDQQQLAKPVGPDPVSASENKATDTPVAKAPEPTLDEVLAGLAAGDRKEIERNSRLIQQLDARSVEDNHAKLTACAELRTLLGSAFVAFARRELNCAKAHAHRLAGAGELVARWTPVGDDWKLLQHESHFRPLLNLAPEVQDAALATLVRWRAWNKSLRISEQVVTAALRVVNPPTGPRETLSVRATIIAEVKAIMDEQRKSLPASVSQTVTRRLDLTQRKIAALAGPRRTTGIQWTTATWNPIHGCTRASRGCDFCYAATLTGTRLADKYPGLAREITVNGVKRFAFTGKIALAPEQLAKPLSDRDPKMWFVNSMADIFHKNVPEEFIVAVFEVMEKSPWHTYQLLTKRPERMARFTQARYQDKAPPPNVWLGTSVEDQEAFDARWPHLREVVTAVRWLSCEPLLGNIRLTRVGDLHWVVAGGESGSDRKMKKEWATRLRDQCSAAEIPFFFKQWGTFGEDGERLTVAERAADGLPKLEGKAHGAFPVGPMVE